MDNSITKSEKVLKMEKFGWRDIVTFISYFVIMFVSIFIATFVLIMIYVFMNNGSMDQATLMDQAMNEILLDATIWGTFISGVSSAIVICFLYWAMIVDSWKRFWEKWKKNILIIILAYVVVIVFEMLFSTFVSTETSANQETIEKMFADASIIQMLALQIPVVFCAPITEEFLCRKVLFGSYKNNKIVGTIMFIVSSVFFGLLHYGFDGNFLLLVPYMFMGAVLAAVYWMTDNIFTAIGLHFMNNAIASILILLLPALGGM